MRVPPTTDSPVNPGFDADHMQIDTLVSDAALNTERARKRAFEEFQPEASPAEQPAKKRTRWEQWTSPENVLFRLIPQLIASSPINPFKAVEIVVQWREGDESISFQVPALVLIRLSSKFKEVLSTVGPDGKIHWKGIHPQAVAQIIEFGHSDSGIFELRECRTIRQLQQQFPTEFMTILSDMMKLISVYDIDEFKCSPLLRFIREELQSDNKEKFRRYFAWGRENRANMDLFVSVLETMMEFAKDRGMLCAGLSFLFNSDYSHLKPQEQVMVRGWIREMFSRVVSKTVEELEEEADEDIGFETKEVFKCLVDLYPRLDFPEGLLEILSHLPIPEDILETRSDLPIPGISQSDPMIYVIRFCEIHRYFSTALDFSDGREIPMNPSLRVPEIYALGKLKRYQRLFNVMKLPFGQQEQIQQLNLLLQDDPENVFALKFRALIWRFQSNFSEAIKDLNKVIELCPHDTLALRNRAFCHFKSHEVQPSIADITRLISLNPHDGKGKLLLAEIYYSIGSFDEALNEVVNAIENLADISLFHSICAYYLKGRCLKKLEKGEEAIAAFGQALSLDPNHIGSLEARGRIYFEFKKDARSAFLDFDRLAHLRPDYPTAFLFKALCWKQNALELKRARVLEDAQTAFNAALANFSHAIQLAPHHPRNFGLRGELYQEWGMANEAVEDFTRALALEPNNAVYILHRADGLLMLNRMQDAWNAYIQASTIDPNDPYPYYGLAECYSKAGDQQKQLEQLNIALRLEGDFELALLKRAQCYFDQGKMDEAFIDLDRAVKCAPDSAQAWAYRGRWFDLAEDHQAALRDLNRAIELDGFNDEFYRMRGDAYLHQLELETALRDYDRAIELNPRNAMTFALRGDCYLEMKKFKEGIHDLDRSIELDPNLQYARFARGFHYAEVNEHEKALEDLDHMIKMAPEDIQGYIMRGESYRALRRFDEAIADFNQAIALEASAASPHAYIAVCYMEKGQFDRAREHIEQALELKPDFPYAENIKEEIELVASKAKR